MHAVLGKCVATVDSIIIMPLVSYNIICIVFKAKQIYRNGEGQSLYTHQICSADLKTKNDVINSVNETPIACFSQCTFVTKNQFSVVPEPI